MVSRQAVTARGVGSRLLAVWPARGEREQDRDHLVQVGPGHRPPGDPPQIMLVRVPVCRLSMASRRYTVPGQASSTSSLGQRRAGMHRGCHYLGIYQKKNQQ
jgi:hypothetical protein